MKPPKALRKPPDQMTPEELAQRFAWDLVNPPVAGPRTVVWNTLWSAFIGSQLGFAIQALVEHWSQGAYWVNVGLFGAVLALQAALMVRQARADRRFRAGQLQMVMQMAERSAHATLGLAQQVDEVFRRAD